jgi:hypothetical protein
MVLHNGRRPGPKVIEMPLIDGLHHHYLRQAA